MRGRKHSLLLAEGAIIVEKFISEWYDLNAKESGKFEFVKELAYKI